MESKRTKQVKCVFCGLRTNKEQNPQFPCQSSGPGLSEQAKGNTFMAGEKGVAGRITAPGGYMGWMWGDALRAIAFLLLLPSLPEHSGEAARRRQGSSPGRRRGQSSAEPAVRLLPVSALLSPGSSYKIAVVSFV